MAASLQAHAGGLSPREVPQALWALARLQRAAPTAGATGDATAGAAAVASRGAVDALIGQTRRLVRGMSPHDVALLLRACKVLGRHPGMAVLVESQQQLRRRWADVTPGQAATVQRCLRAMDTKRFRGQLPPEAE